MNERHSSRRDVEDDLPILMERARSAYEEGDFNRANELLEIASRSPRADSLVFHRLGLVRYELEDFAGAIEAYSRSVKDIPDSLVNRGLCYDTLGMNALARNDYEAALAADPTDVAAIVNLGTLDLEEGHVLEAKRRLLQAVAIDPTANWQLSDVYIREGDLESAERALQGAIENGEGRAVKALADLRSSDDYQSPSR